MSTFLETTWFRFDLQEYASRNIFCIRLVDSHEMAFPMMLWCLNAVLNFVIKSAKVPRVNVVLKMAL